MKALLAVVQLCVVIEVSTGAVHYGPLCTIWILGTEEFRQFQLFVWITNRRDSEVGCTSLHIALLGLLRHLPTLLKPKQYHLCSGYFSYSDFCRSSIFPHPSSCRLLSMVEAGTKENKGRNHYLVGTRSLWEALFALMRFWHGKPCEKRMASHTEHHSPSQPVSWGRLLSTKLIFLS